MANLPVYGVGAPLVIAAAPAVQVTTAPGNSTLAYDVGQVLIVRANGATPASAHMLLSKLRVAGVMTANWSQIDNESGAGVFANLTVTPGPTSLTGVFTTAGGTASINASSNFATNINTGTSTGAVSIGNTLAGAVSVDSSAAITVSGAQAAATAIVINATNAVGGIDIRAGTGGIDIGTDADTTPITIGDIAPTASRTITISGGTVVTAAVTDTLDLAPDGATTNANSVKTVNINTGTVVTGQVLTNVASGAVTSGTHTTAIATGNRAAGTMALNVMTGTGTKTANLGNADALTTFNVDAITLINDSVNAATSINTGTSTGTISIGNALAGAIAVDSGAASTMNFAAASGSALIIDATNAVGGLQFRAGTGGILIGTEADTTPISIGDIAPTASRTITVGGGTVVTAAVTDTIDIAPDGATTNANSIKTVNINTGTVATGELHTNIASGTITSGTHAVAISTGNVAAGTVTLDIMTGTGTKTANLGNADALTTLNVDAILLINDSVNANTRINTGTSTGIIAIGNSLAGAVTVDSAAGISLDGATASNFTVTGAGQDLTLSSSGGSLVISASEALATAIAITATDAAGGITIQAGTGGILVGNEADTSTISIGDVAPTSSRTITVGGGTIVTAAVTDTIDIGPDGATTNANSIKTVNINTGGVTTGEVLTNIASGVVTSGTHTTAIASGNRVAGTMALNVMTGTGTKTANLGNADALTTLNIDAITLINDSVNAATSINTGTSTGTVSIGNSAAGAITIDTAAGISIDGATASNFTLTGAVDLTLSSTAGSVIASAGEAVIDAVQLTASNAAGGVRVTSGTLAATTGLNLVQGAVNASIQVGTGDPVHSAPKGSLFLKTDATTTTTRLWIATDAVGGWTFFTSNA